MTLVSEGLQVSPQVLSFTTYRVLLSVLHHGASAMGGQVGIPHLWSGLVHRWLTADSFHLQGRPVCEFVQQLCNCNNSKFSAIYTQRFEMLLNCFGLDSHNFPFILQKVYTAELYYFSVAMTVFSMVAISESNAEEHV